MARPLSELTKLILSLPSDMRVADVVAKANEKGMTTSKGNVHQVRSKHGGKAAKGSRKPAQPTKKTSAKGGAGHRSSPKKEAILAIGLNKPTVEIIAAAKAKGVKVSSKKRAPRAAASAPGAGGGGLSKSDFIRSLSSALKASEVVKAGKAAGVKLDVDYVYKVRRLAKQGRGHTRAAVKAAPAAKRGPGRPPTTASSSSSNANTAQGFRKLVLELGISHARQLIDDVAKKLEAIVKG